MTLDVREAEKRAKEAKEPPHYVSLALADDVPALADLARRLVNVGTALRNAAAPHLVDDPDLCDALGNWDAESRRVRAVGLLEDKA